MIPARPPVITKQVAEGFASGFLEPRPPPLLPPVEEKISLSSGTLSSTPTVASGVEFFREGPGAGAHPRLQRCPPKTLPDRRYATAKILLYVPARDLLHRDFSPVGGAEERLSKDLWTFGAVSRWRRAQRVSQAGARVRVGPLTGAHLGRSFLSSSWLGWLRRQDSCSSLERRTFSSRWRSSSRESLSRSSSRLCLSVMFRCSFRLSSRWCVHPRKRLPGCPPGPQRTFLCGHVFVKRLTKTLHGLPLPIQQSLQHPPESLVFCIVHATPPFVLPPRPGSKANNPSPESRAGYYAQRHTVK